MGLKKNFLTFKSVLYTHAAQQPNHGFIFIFGEILFFLFFLFFFRIYNELNFFVSLFFSFFIGRFFWNVLNMFSIFDNFYSKILMFEGKFVSRKYYLLFTSFFIYLLENFKIFRENKLPLLKNLPNIKFNLYHYFKIILNYIKVIYKDSTIYYKKFFLKKFFIYYFLYLLEILNSIYIFSFNFIYALPNNCLFVCFNLEKKIKLYIFSYFFSFYNKLLKLNLLYYILYYILYYFRIYLIFFLTYL